MSRLLRRAALWLPPLLWAGVIYALSSQTRLPSPADPLWDRLVSTGAHMAEYAILAWLLWRPLTRRGTRGGAGAYLAVWAVALAYAVLDEYHQSFVPGRVADAADVAADAIGAALALALLWRFGRRRRQRSPRESPSNELGAVGPAANRRPTPTTDSLFVESAPDAQGTRIVAAHWPENGAARRFHACWCPPGHDVSTL